MVQQPIKPGTELKGWKSLINTDEEEVTPHLAEDFMLTRTPPRANSTESKFVRTPPRSFTESNPPPVQGVFRPKLPQK